MRNVRQMPCPISSRRLTILIMPNRRPPRTTLPHRPILRVNQSQRQKSLGWTPYLPNKICRRGRERTGAHQVMQCQTWWKQSQTPLYQRCHCRMKAQGKETRTKAVAMTLTNLLKSKMTWETTTLEISMTGSKNLATRLRKLPQPAASRLSNLSPLPPS